MVVFEEKFDLETFQECLKYVQDSLDWLIASEEDSYYRQVQRVLRTSTY